MTAMDSPTPPQSRMTRRIARRACGRAAGGIWTAAGLALPVIIGLMAHEQLLGSTTILTLVLMVFAMAGSNVELRFTLDERAPMYSPVGVPIVIAIVACTPAQAMAVASMGYLLDRATWRRGPQYALETAGLGAMSTLGAAVLIDWLGMSFSLPAMTMLAALTASVSFLLLDALTYAVWYQLESGDGAEVVRYFLRAAPVDIMFTAVAVTLVGPFVGSPLVVAAMLVGSQIAIYALYRMATSESRHRKQSHHLRDVFGRYVPEAIVEQLAESSAQVRLGGEARDVSVMFCDIRGFTSWSENNPPERVVAELNGLLGALAQIVLESGGTLDKFTGDGLMAFWGAPLQQKDHAERACGAAVEMQKLLDRRAESGSACEPFRIGIGISSGSVIVGNVGHEKRLEYTAIGDTVNLAARLEQLTKDLDVTTVVAHETWLLLPPEAQVGLPESATVHVRGRQRPVRIHELAMSSIVSSTAGREIAAP